MSIIAAILTEDIFYIATDTLISRKDKEGKTPFPGIPIGYQSKITQYPHLKGAVVGMGCSHMSDLHNSFVLNNQFDGIDDLYERTISEFAKTVPCEGDYIDGEDNMIGTLLLFGNNEFEDKLAAYSIQVLRGNVLKSERIKISDDKENIKTLMSPRLTQQQETEIMDKVIGNGGDVLQVLFALCSKLVDNSRSADTFVFPLGGEFIYTTMSVQNGVYNSTTSNLGKFNNWDETNYAIHLYNEMMSRVHKKLQFERGLGI